MLTPGFYQKDYIYVCAYAYTMTKVISLSNEAYGRLKTLKMPGESFSDVVLKISPQKKSIKTFFGKWKEESNEWDDIKRDLEKERAEFHTRGDK